MRSTCLASRRVLGYADAVFRHDRSSSEFFGAQTAWNGNGWTMTFLNGSKIYFPEAYYAKNFAQGAPTQMLDTEGRRIQLKRNSVRNLEELISPGGHTIDFKYDSADRIAEAKDDAGDVRRYSYDRTGHLDSVSDAAKVLYRFEYHRLMGGPDNDPYLLTAVLEGIGMCSSGIDFSTGECPSKLFPTDVPTSMNTISGVRN
jgi:YD repeat-containing protein